MFQTKKSQKGKNKGGMICEGIKCNEQRNK
jgi:hypothetical protein